MRRRALFLLLLLSIYVTIGKLRAQSVAEDNLYLLVHPNFHEIYLNLKMSQGQSYLSLIEVLQLFEIPFSVGKDSAGNVTTVSGGPQQISDWKIDFRNSIVYMKAKFASGGIELLPEGRGIVRRIIGQVRQMSPVDFKIDVEGHTDSAPINSYRFQDNWDLSVARAAGVVRLFVEDGFAADKLKASGFGSARCLVKDRDEQGRLIPEKQDVNRRIVVRLYYD